MPAAEPTIAERLEKVVAELLGGAVTAVRPMQPEASTGRTFAVTLDDGRAVVAKLSQPGHSVAPMARNLEVLGGLGVPAPRVLSIGSLSIGSLGGGSLGGGSLGGGSLGGGSLGGDPVREVLVMSRLPGRDLRQVMPVLTRDQLSVLAQQVIGIQGVVAALPVHGDCGYVAIGEPGRRNWLDVVRRPNSYRFADPLPPDTVTLAPRLWQLIDAAAERLARVRPVCFLDDLTTKNVLIDGGRLSGVVDFDWICQGDPRFHLGLTAAAVVTVEHARWGGHYVNELIRAAGLGAEDQRFVDLYTALFLVNFLGAESPHRPGPWRARAARAAHAALDRATAFFG